MCAIYLAAKHRTEFKKVKKAQAKLKSITDTFSQTVQLFHLNFSLIILHTLFHPFLFSNISCLHS